jgi:hypothetical protein
MNKNYQKCLAAQKDKICQRHLATTKHFRTNKIVKNVWQLPNAFTQIETIENAW